MAAEAVGLRQAAVAAEDGHTRTLAWIVDGHPADAAHLVGQPVAQLGDKGIGAPGHTDGAAELDRAGLQQVERALGVAAHPGIGDGADDGVVDHRAVLQAALGHGLDIAAHIHIGALIGGAQQQHHVGDVDVLVGLDRERQLGHIHRQAQRRSQSVEDEEFAFAEVLAVGIAGVEGFPEDEVALAVPKAVAACHLLDVVGAHKIFRVVALQTADARYVGADAHVVVGDALCGPYAADAVGAFAQYLHLPHLVTVGDGYALATVAIAVLAHQTADEAYGVAGVVAAHKCHALKLFDKEHTILVDQRVGASEGGLAYGQLLFVEAGIGRVEIGVGVAHLRDGAGGADTSGVVAKGGVHSALADGVHCASLVVGGGFDSHPGAVAAVAGVRGDDRAVGRGLLAHHNGGARLAVNDLRVVVLTVADAYGQDHT